MSLKIRLARAGTKKRPVYHIVIADSRYLAEDAAELVEVSYEPLPPILNPEQAVEVSRAAHRDDHHCQQSRGYA